MSIYIYIIIITYPGQEAYHGLHLVPPHRISNKGHALAPDHIQELVRVENRQITPVRLPPPFHEPGIGPPVFHAVLVLVDCPTSLVGVIRSLRIGNPFPREDIAFFLIVCYLNVVLCMV